MIVDRTFVPLLLIFTSTLPLSLSAQPSTLSNADSPSTPGYSPDRIIIQPKLTASQPSTFGKVIHTFPGLHNLQVIAVPPGETVPGLISKYQQSGLVEFAEPDYIGRTFATSPNDPKYLDGTLWALHNTGTPHADIDAPEAWDVLASASNIVVAVLDTGIRYTHEDLAANMWVNTNDNSHGLNAITGTTDPSDDSGHGTMVAGIIGAVGNNSKGVCGVAWKVQLMACKCFDSTGHGTLTDTLTCIDYARTNGARLLNASFGFPDSLALSNAISSLRDTGIIVAAACGNSGTSVDVDPTYPACYHMDNVVSVAYTTRTDVLAGPSNYGATNVHLAAPGDQIYSTFGATDNFYFTQSGSSFAAPYVVGSLALMLAKFPNDAHQLIISRLLNGTDPLPSLAGKCVTGGRLNLRNALSPPISLATLPVAPGSPFQFRISAGPNRVCVIQSSPDLFTWTSIATNTTSASGTFDFTDTNGVQRQRYYRVKADL